MQFAVVTIISDLRVARFGESGLKGGTSSKKPNVFSCSEIKRDIISSTNTSSHRHNKNTICIFFITIIITLKETKCNHYSREGGGGDC